MTAAVTRKGERIIVRFPARPPREVILDMRRAGFTWSQAKRAWTGPDSEDADQLLRSFEAPLFESAMDSVIHGNCTAVLPRLPAGCIDFVLTDPPYLVNYRDRSGRTLQGDRDSSWLEPAFAEIARVMKPDSLMLSFYGWQAIDRFMAAWRAAGAASRRSHGRQQALHQ